MAESSIAVDIGATKTVVAVFRDQTMHEVARFPTAGAPGDEVDLIISAVRDNDAASAAGAMGIGAPGPLDAGLGRILTPPNLPAWRNFPLADRLQQILGIPVRLENDANLGALGEAASGSGAGYRSMFYLTISTGIGGGLIMDRRIFRGHQGMAGEVFAVEPGHFFGEAGKGDLNELASGPGLVSRARRQLAAGETSSLAKIGPDFDAPQFLAAADSGDAMAVSLLESGRNAIAGLLMTILYAVAPEAVVLAGGLCTESRWYVDPVRERVRRWTAIPELAAVPIERAKLWDKAVLYGAAELVRQAEE